MKLNTLVGLCIAAVAASFASAPVAAQSQGQHAQMPQPVQEVFLNDLVFPQERHETQLTLHSRVDAGAYAQLLGEYGITDRFQVSLTTPTFGRSVDDGDVFGAGVFYALLPHSSLALSASFEVETADGAAPVWSPSLIAAHAFGRVQLHGNAGVEFDGEDRNVTGGLTALFSAGRWTPTLELAAADGSDTYIAPGLFFKPVEAFELGVGVPMCLACSRAGSELHLVFTLEF